MAPNKNGLVPRLYCYRKKFGSEFVCFANKILVLETYSFASQNQLVEKTWRQTNVTWRQDFLVANEYVFATKILVSKTHFQLQKLVGNKN